MEKKYGAPSGYGTNIYLSRETREQARELMERHGWKLAELIRLAIAKMYGEVGDETK